MEKPQDSGPPDGAGCLGGCQGLLPIPIGVDEDTEKADLRVWARVDLLRFHAKVCPLSWGVGVHQTPGLSEGMKR